MRRKKKRKALKLCRKNSFHVSVVYICCTRNQPFILLFSCLLFAWLVAIVCILFWISSLFMLSVLFILDHSASPSCLHYDWCFGSCFWCSCSSLIYLWILLLFVPCTLPAVCVVLSVCPVFLTLSVVEFVVCFFICCISFLCRAVVQSAGVQSPPRRGPVHHDEDVDSCLRPLQRPGPMSLTPLWSVKLFLRQRVGLKAGPQRNGASLLNLPRSRFLPPLAPPWPDRVITRLLVGERQGAAL